MFHRNYALNTAGLSFTGDWKPPSNHVFSAALALAISACFAVRFVLELHR
jgi:hypothetical protein